MKINPLDLARVADVPLADYLAWEMGRGTLSGDAFDRVTQRMVDAMRAVLPFNIEASDAAQVVTTT